MDEITKKKIIIDEVIKFLRTGDYVRFTDKYCGSYWDGANSKDRFKLSKENIFFVNMPDVQTTNGKTLKLKKMILFAEFEGKKEAIPIYLAIDADTWKIYMKL